METVLFLTETGFVFRELLEESVEMLAERIAEFMASRDEHGNYRFVADFEDSSRVVAKDILIHYRFQGRRRYESS